MAVSYMFFPFSLQIQMIKNVAFGVYILSMVSCAHNVILMMHWSASALFKWPSISEASFTKWVHGHDSFVNAEIK